MTLKKTDLRDLTGLIRLKRRELGLTQKQLGDKLGIDQRTVSALEKNPGSISVARLFAVLTALELQVFTSDAGMAEPLPATISIEQFFKSTGIL
jgi:HTH-type transcriptional regulator/antitoxin HipB